MTNLTKHEQILRAVREIEHCLARAAAGEGIQLAAARSKTADLKDWLSSEVPKPHECFTWMELDLIATEAYNAVSNFASDPMFNQVYQKATRMKAGAPGRPVRKGTAHG